MVFEGNTTPGRSSKNSLLSREFKHTDIHHQSVCTEGVVKVKKRDLTYDEKKFMNCEIEQDRMLFNGYDRQSESFQAIDEFDFLSIEPKGWKLEIDPNGSLMIGGLTLRAPRVLVPTPSNKGGVEKDPPVSQEREMLQT